MESSKIREHLEYIRGEKEVLALAVGALVHVCIYVYVSCMCDMWARRAH